MRDRVLMLLEVLTVSTPYPVVQCTLDIIVSATLRIFYSTYYLSCNVILG